MARYCGKEAPLPGEGRGSSSEPDEAPAARSAHADGSMTLGLIAAPDIPEKIAKELATDLPKRLSKYVDDSVSWDVSVVVDPLTGTEREAPEILDVCQERLEHEGWDLAVCLTDLPIYRSGQIVVADVSTKRRVAGLSLPVLGATRLLPRLGHFPIPSLRLRPVAHRASMRFALESETRSEHRDQERRILSPAQFQVSFHPKYRSSL